MSLIATCELCGANPFDYLTELDRHASEAATHPAAWMPWNYRETLAGLATLPGTANWPFLTPRGPGKPTAQRFCTLTGTVRPISTKKGHGIAEISRPGPDVSGTLRVPPGYPLAGDGTPTTPTNASRRCPMAPGAGYIYSARIPRARRAGRAAGDGA